MWRDRTNLYISYRQSYGHHPPKRKYGSGPPARPSHHGFSDPFSAAADRGSGEDRQGLLSSSAFDDDDYVSADAVIEMDVLPPRWADVTDEITDLLDQVSRKSQTLERLHHKHVLPAFNDEGAKRAEEAEIERLTQDITRAFHECQTHIKRVGQMVHESQKNNTITRAEEAMAKNIQVSLAARVQEASAGFRKKQSAYLKKLRGLSGLSTPTAGDRSSTPLLQNTYNPNPSLVESDADRSYSQSTLQQQSLLHASANDTLIQQREREINDIAQGIIELSDLFRDLQAMVIDQGTMLDRVDYNIERMATDVRGAEKEIIVAAGYQKKTTKRKIILLLLLIIVGMIILLVIKPKKHPSLPEPRQNPG